ncbi:hypothetical protein BH20ACT9_BH20ACT9_07330 [soil metagenome]
MRATTDDVLAHIEHLAYSKSARFDDVDERVAMALGVPYHAYVSYLVVAHAAARYEAEHEVMVLDEPAPSAPGSSGCWPVPEMSRDGG